VPRLPIPFLMTLVLLACASVLAEQASKDKPAQTQSNDTSAAPTVGSAVNRPSSLLPSSDASSEEKAKPTTQVEGQLMHATPSPELDSYLKSSVLPLVRANWYQLVSKSKELGGDVTVEFTIMKDGSTRAAKLTEGPGHRILGDLATTAISKSGPFAPLPANVTSVDVRTTFSYQPAVNGQSTDGASGAGFSGTCNKEKNSNCVTPPQVILSPPPQDALGSASGSTTYAGKATLQLIVTKEGKPTDIKVLKSLGPELDQKAIAAVQNWKFLPATKNGTPVATQIVVEVEFHLNDQK